MDSNDRRAGEPYSPEGIQVGSAKVDEGEVGGMEWEVAV
jgi:hypothetical protein